MAESAHVSHRSVDTVAWGVSAQRPGHMATHAGRGRRRGGYAAAVRGRGQRGARPAERVARVGRTNYHERGARHSTLPVRRPEVDAGCSCQWMPTACDACRSVVKCVVLMHVLTAPAAAPWLQRP